MVNLVLLAFVSNSQNLLIERIIANNEGLHIGGYGQIDMNLPISDGNVHNNVQVRCAQISYFSRV